MIGLETNLDGLIYFASRIILTKNGERINKITDATIQYFLAKKILTFFQRGVNSGFSCKK